MSKERKELILLIVVVAIVWALFFYSMRLASSLGRF